MTTISANISESLCDWIDEQIHHGRIKSRSSLIQSLLRAYQAGQMEVPEDIGFEDAEGATEKELNPWVLDAMRDLQTLPMIRGDDKGPGGTKEGRAVNFRIPYSILRGIEEIYTDPRTPYKVFGDAARSMLWIGCRAVLAMIKDPSHPIFAMLQADALLKSFEDMEANKDQLHLMSEFLYERLLDAHDRSDDQLALAAWMEYYEYARRLAPPLDTDATRVLRQLPLSQDLAFRLPDLIPDESFVPSVPPYPQTLRDPIGLYPGREKKDARKAQRS